tara:strand:- start:312 stop:515 length:204 start_codon:yes stop_codon:yes gene_type:complete
MYGLFKMSFDYYCWEDLIGVSDSVDKLKAYHSDNIDCYPLYSKEKSSEIRDGRTEEFHCVIHAIKVI